MRGGIQHALFDDQRAGRCVEITDNAVAWIIDIACQSPADLGNAQEPWALIRQSFSCANQATPDSVIEKQATDTIICLDCLLFDVSL